MHAEPCDRSGAPPHGSRKQGSGSLVCSQQQTNGLGLVWLTKRGAGSVPVWKQPCYIWCSISQTQTCPHFALLFPLNSHQPVQQSLQDVRQRPAKRQEGPGSWAWHQGQPQGAEPSAAKSVTSAVGGTHCSAQMPTWMAAQMRLDFCSECCWHRVRVWCLCLSNLEQNKLSSNRFFRFPLAFHPTRCVACKLHSCCNSFPLR